MGQVHCAGAPAYIREKSKRVMRAVGPSVNFDRGGRPVNLGESIRIVDCGDVPFDPIDIPNGVNRTAQAIQKLLQRGAVPVVFGGDDAVPIPVVRGYKEKGPIVVVQIDEHLDWSKGITRGVTDGYSSPMRRISEMSWVKQTIQVGLHSFGPAEQVEDARAAGNLLITEGEVHEQGVPAVLDKIPGGEDYFVTLDFDGLDTLACPAVSHPEPGGLTYREAVDLLCGLAGKGRIVGMDFVEFVPDHDVNGLGGHTTCRLITNVLHAMVESGQFE